MQAFLFMVLVLQAQLCKTSGWFSSCAASCKDGLLSRRVLICYQLSQTDEHIVLFTSTCECFSTVSYNCCGAVELRRCSIILYALTYVYNNI